MWPNLLGKIMNINIFLFLFLILRTFFFTPHLQLFFFSSIFCDHLLHIFHESGVCSVTLTLSLIPSINLNCIPSSDFVLSIFPLILAIYLYGSTLEENVFNSSIAAFQVFIGLPPFLVPGTCYTLILCITFAVFLVLFMLTRPSQMTFFFVNVLSHVIYRY